MGSVNTPAQQLVSAKNKYYEDVTRYARWLAIITVAGTFPYSSPHRTWIIRLLVLATVYNILRYSPLLRLPLFASKINMLVTDNFFVACLLLLTGGISSPYAPFFIFMIMTASFWYGLRGLITVVGVQTTIVVTMSLFDLGSAIPDAGIRLTGLRILNLVIMGYLVERLTHAERSEHVKAEEIYKEVETQRQRLLALINSLGDGVVAIDPNSIITLYNGAALDLINTNENLVGKNIKDVLPLEDASKQPVDIIALSSKSPGVYRSDDLLYKAKDEVSLSLSVSAAPIRMPSEEHPTPTGFILVLRDITKAKSLEELREEFVSVTSHELRTPVAIAEANISTILFPGFTRLEPKATALLEQAHQKIIFLGQLINDLSTLTKAEQGDLTVELELIEPAKLLAELASDNQEKATEKGLTVKCGTVAKLPPILTSKPRVKEILQNLLTNAIKYTQKGGITLGTEKGEKPGSVVFSVADTGIGVSATDKKHLFEKFYRSEDYRTRETGGTGLGLYIAIKLAERLNAKIWFKSKLNEGSVFYLEVPPYSQLKEDYRQVVSAEMKNLVETI